MFKLIAKKLSSLFLIAAVALMTACSGLTNLTPDSVPDNPSRKYTLTMSAYINDGSIIQRSIEPYVVIDEVYQKMRVVSELEHERIYEYDYYLPKGRKEAKYYFVLKYKSDMGASGIVDRTMTTKEIYKISPATRYVTSMQYERGPVGAEIPVLGRGFDKLDKIIIGGIPADTTYLSRTTLNFIVPPLAADKNYSVELQNADGSTSWIGMFRVDAGQMLISPQVINAESGDTLNMIFDISFKAPEKGYYIDVKTNIPSTIVLPEIYVKEGQSSVSVPVKLAAPGKGALYVNAVGFNETVIPVNVSESAVTEITTESEVIEVKPVEVAPVIEPVAEPVIAPAPVVEEAKEQPVVEVQKVEKEPEADTK